MQSFPDVRLRHLAGACYSLGPRATYESSANCETEPTFASGLNATRSLTPRSSQSSAVGTSPR